MCFLANVGQEEDWEEVERKALKIGANQMVIEDLQKEFVEDLCFRAVQCNAQVRLFGLPTGTRRLIRTTVRRSLPFRNEFGAPSHCKGTNPRCSAHRLRVR